MEIDNWKERIKPFEWVQYKERFSVCLETGGYLQDVFDVRSDEGFEGNGYDWESLAKVFLEERCQNLSDKLEFDSEADMFCVYSEDDKSLQDFICLFKETCEDEKLIKDLFSRAELN